MGLVIAFLAEGGHAEVVPFWHFSEWLPAYYDLLRSPSHIALELTLMLIFDGIIFGLIWKTLRNYVKKHHTDDVEQIVSAEHQYHDTNEVEVRIQRIERMVEVLLNQQEKQKRKSG